MIDITSKRRQAQAKNAIITSTNIYGNFVSTDIRYSILSLLKWDYGKTALNGIC